MGYPIITRDFDCKVNWTHKTSNMADCRNIGNPVLPSFLYILLINAISYSV